MDKRLAPFSLLLLLCCALAMASVTENVCSRVRVEVTTSSAGMVVSETSAATRVGGTRAAVSGPMARPGS